MTATIACAVDWSRDRRILALAEALAARCGARLEVLHVGTFGPEALLRERGEQFHDLIRSVMGGGEVVVRLATGDPEERLVAASRSAALLVVSRREADVLRRPLHSDIVARLIRRAACPVVIIPSRVRDGDTLSLSDRRLVCGVRDERDLACAATAAAWAAELDLGLTLARAMPMPGMPVSPGFPAAPPCPPRTPAEAEAAGMESLSRLAEQVALIGPGDVRTLVTFGARGPRLRRAARAEHAALIALGPARHRALHAAINRSPIEHLLRRAPCPVMVCPRPDATLAAAEHTARTAASRR